MTSDRDEPPPFEEEPQRALEHAQAVSRALADAARRARFSARARGAYRGGSFAARRGARAFRVLTFALFVALVALPNIAASVYLGLLASDQFVSEAKFTVSSGAIPKLDALGSVTGLPSMEIFQDTQIAINFIESRAMVEQLERRVGLRDAYGSEKIDWIARFNKSRPIEKFTDYWANNWLTKMCDVSISLPSGIVTLKIRAFSPSDAKRIAKAVIELTERQINNLNDRMWRDTVHFSEQELQRAGERLKAARVRYEKVRNLEGLLDVRQTSDALNGLLAQLETDTLTAQQDYQTQSQYVAEAAPQLRVLKARIDAMNSQIAELKTQITARKEKSISAIAEKALSGKMTKFAELDLEQQIATQRYSSAVTAVEAARIMGENKMIYLHQIVAPALPEESLYPRRWLTFGLILLASLLLWGASVGVATFVRNHMA
jgi:capsular polysaccharide transport system permease protein